MEIVKDLQSTHEEADTRLLFHAQHASRGNCKSVVIVSEDTDVLILCLAFQARISCSLYQKCGTQTRVRYIDISKVKQAVGEDVSKTLPGVHSFTGCDSQLAPLLIVVKSVHCKWLDVRELS